MKENSNKVLSFPSRVPAKADYQRVKANYSIREIKQLFGLSERTIRRWTEQGIIQGAPTPEANDYIYDFQALTQFRRVRELRAQGFVPHAFPAIKKWMIAPLSTDDPYAALNQLLEADIVYVRDFSRPDKMSSEQLKHLALVAHHCYGSWDLAANCIHHLAARGAGPTDSMTQYLTLMRQG